MIQPVYGTQQMQPQQVSQPQGMLQPVYTTQQQQPAQQVIPQQHLVQQQQQQLNPQQQQWNNGMQTILSNQPQPGLLYAQQRMNNS
jgi:hypothetical protein